MGAASVIPPLFCALFALFIGYKFNQSILKSFPPPKLDEPYWGPGEPITDDPAVSPFKINIPDSVLNDLRERLTIRRPLTAPLEGSNHHYGINSYLLTEILDYWNLEYKWRKREAFLNTYPQFKTKVQGLDIHFIRVTPEKKEGLKVYPLLMLHGWPGSVREFYEVIPLLTKQQPGRNFVFELIIPSLPGYGFSQGASKPGLGGTQAAVLFKNLMVKLGFEKWYLQGGDWGAMIVQHMSALFEDRILGVHSNMCMVDSPLANLKLLLGSIYPPLIVDKKYESKMYPLSTFFYNVLLEFGYMHIQATKPDTVGVALNQSPAGLAGYILEKFITWTNADNKDKLDGNLKSKFTYETLIDNVMIYWVTNSITTSFRMYAESVNTKSVELQMGRVQVKVPSACARYRHELVYQPDFILKDTYTNLVHSADYDDGGHFPALEVPDLFAKDIYDAFEKITKN